MSALSIARQPALGLALTFLCAMLPLACATQERSALVKIEVIPQPLSPGLGAGAQKQKLLQLTEDQENWRLAVRDVVIALEAEEAEVKQDWELAGRKWLEVMQIDTGSLAAEAFQRWISASDKALAAGTPAETLARLLLAETHEGLTSPWLQKQKLTQLEPLSKKIEEKRRGKSIVASESVAWPADPSAISEDPFWEKAAKLACGRELTESWVRWERRLPTAQRDYWKGLLASCRKDYQAAVLALQAALTSFEKDEVSSVLAINAADRLVQAQKRLGRREEAAAAYRLHHKLLLGTRTEPSAFGWSAYELLRRQVEAGLWVGRMQALLGDYQSARVAVQQSIDQINKAFASIVDLSRQQKINLDEQKADAYHILSSRVAFEQKDYAGALAFNKVAQGLPELGKDWRQRLLWSEGWYSYLLADKPAALRAWTQLLAQSRDEGQLARLNYWLGRTHEEMGLTSEADVHFERLTSEHPLNYYTLVALPLLRPAYAWRERWLEQGEAAERLIAADTFKAEAFEADPEASRRLLRAELALAAGIESWAGPLSRELYRYVSQKGSLLKELEASLYVTRLLHMSAQHLLAISLTTQLNGLHPALWQDYPEQLLVYYPQPYLSSYQRAAAQHYIDPELSLAISRQESSFQADAESPAEAVGLMQLIPPTAERQAARLGVKLEDAATDLKRPDLNISLGTAYLAELGRRYRGKWPQAFAAYNAGEYVVDAWILRRAAVDPVIWTEALSFGETSSYVKNVWRNWEVYRLLKSGR